MPRHTPQPWLAYLGVFLAVAGFVGGLANAWYGLQQRVHDLERTQNFLHGPIDLPKEAK